MQDHIDGLTGPQPLGAFSYPEGLLLIAGTDPEVDAVRRELSAGRIPTEWPDALAGHRAAYQGRPDAALFVGDDAVTRYNRWVLDPSSASVDAVRASLPSAYAPLADIVGFGMGMLDATDLPEPAEDLAPEVSSLLLGAWAAALSAAGDLSGAVEVLTQAATTGEHDAPALSALLRGNAGMMLHRHAAGDLRARAMLGRATDELARTALRVPRAQMLHLLGTIARDEATAEGAPQGVAATYFEAASEIVERDQTPELWGNITLDLATARLFTPPDPDSDFLNLYLAMAGFRTCRSFFGAADEPERWSRTTIGLAQCLVELSKTGRSDSRAEAVNLYEEVLDAGVLREDRTEHAHIRVDCAELLTDLGEDARAASHLQQAERLFRSIDDEDGAERVRRATDRQMKVTIREGDAPRPEPTRRPEAIRPALRSAALAARQIEKIDNVEATALAIALYEPPVKTPSAPVQEVGKRKKRKMRLFRDA